MIRKASLLAISIASFVASASAQVDFGLRVGGSYSSLRQKMNDVYVSSGKAGFSVAGIADIALKRGFSFRPELAFVNQGGAYYSQPMSEGMAAYNKYKYYSLQLPLDVAYTVDMSDIRLSVFAGPTLDFSLFGKMRTRDAIEDAEMQFGSTPEKDLQFFDLGVKLGLAVEYSKFFFSIDAVLGTLDRRAEKREGESVLLQNNVTFSLGYFFRK